MKSGRFTKRKRTRLRTQVAKRSVQPALRSDHLDLIDGTTGARLRYRGLALVVRLQSPIYGNSMAYTILTFQFVARLMGAFGLLVAVSTVRGHDGVYCRVHLKVVSPLEYRNTPMDPVIDFGDLIRKAGLSGALDPNSIHILDAVDGSLVAHATTDDFAYGDKGRIEWVIADPGRTDYDIRFRVVARRPALQQQAYVPPIGVGDLLRYNAGVRRPIGVPLVSGLVDLTGDGRGTSSGVGTTPTVRVTLGTGLSVTRALALSTDGSSEISCVCGTANGRVRRIGDTSRTRIWPLTSPISIAMASLISSGATWERQGDVFSQHWYSRCVRPTDLRSLRFGARFWLGGLPSRRPQWGRRL